MRVGGDAVAIAVADYFGHRAGRYGLGAGLRVASHLNWGGFGNLWDDLTLGDPAIDYGTFLWPLWRDGGDPAAWLARRGQDRGLAERLELYRRAALLDEVIDSLADWVEAERMPEHRERVRSAKLNVHERALADYRRRYGEAEA